MNSDHFAKLDRILAVVRWAFPTSHPVIGGGALRDHLLNRPIKDVDVFLRAKDHDNLDSELTKRIRPPLLAQLYGRPDMHGAWDFQQILEGFQVQLILAEFETKEDLAHTFDLGLSRVTYDETGLYVTSEFDADAINKVFRVYRADNNYELKRTLRRIERLSEKYPDFFHEVSLIESAASAGTILS